MKASLDFSKVTFAGKPAILRLNHGKIAMNEVAEYFIICGVLVVIYLAVRFPLVDFLDSRIKRDSSSIKGKGIEATAICSRVENIREELRQAHKLANPPFKREFLVAAKREQMSKLSFFQPVPTPATEPHEYEGMNLMMI